MSKSATTQSSKQNKTLLTAAIILFAAVLIFFGAYQIFAPQASEGAKTITIEVIDNTQACSEYTTHTDAEYLLDAMKDTPKFTFSGYEGPYGLTLTAINGITADWEKDNAYWAVYVNGELANYGVSSQPIANGDVFRFEYTGLNADA